MSTTVAPRPHHEPEENELQVAALLDGLVDALDHALGRALHHGLGAQVQQVVARHLPPPAKAERDAPSGAAAKRAPDAPSKSRLAADQLNVLIGLLHAVTALDEHARRSKADGPTSRRDASCRDFLRALTEAVKRGDITINRWETEA